MKTFEEFSLKTQKAIKALRLHLKSFLSFNICSVIERPKDEPYLDINYSDNYFYWNGPNGYGSYFCRPYIVGFLMSAGCDVHEVHDVYHYAQSKLYWFPAEKTNEKI